MWWLRWRVGAVVVGPTPTILVRDLPPSPDGGGPLGNDAYRLDRVHLVLDGARMGPVVAKVEHILELVRDLHGPCDLDRVDVQTLERQGAERGGAEFLCRLGVGHGAPVGEGEGAQVREVPAGEGCV